MSQGSGSLAGPVKVADLFWLIPLWLSYQTSFTLENEKIKFFWSYSFCSYYQFKLKIGKNTSFAGLHLLGHLESYPIYPHILDHKTSPLTFYLQSWTKTTRSEQFECYAGEGSKRNAHHAHRLSVANLINVLILTSSVTQHNRQCCTTVKVNSYLAFDVLCKQISKKRQDHWNNAYNAVQRLSSVHPMSFTKHCVINMQACTYAVNIFVVLKAYLDNEVLCKKRLNTYLRCRSIDYG